MRNFSRKLALIAALSIPQAPAAIAQGTANVSATWFTQGRLASNVSVTNSSARTLLPTSGLITWVCNVGTTNDAFIAFGGSTVSVTATTGTWLKAGTCGGYSLVPVSSGGTRAGYIAAITASSTTTLRVETGSGTPPAGLTSSSSGGGGTTDITAVDGVAVTGGVAGSLPVTIVSGGGSGGTASSFSAAFPAVGTAIGIYDGTNMVPMLTALTLGDGVNGNNTAATAKWLFNGTTWDRARGDATNGAWVNVKTSVLPTGAATETTLAALNTKTPSLGQTTMSASVPVAIASNQTALPVTGTFWQATQPVSGTFWQATQPVSLASVPGHSVFGPTAVGSPAANPPVLFAGTANATATGNVQVAKVDTAGTVFTDAVLGGNLLTAMATGVGTPGSAAPGTGLYVGGDVAGTFRGWSFSNPTGTVYAGKTDLVALNGTTVLTGTGATGTGAQRVTVATDQATNAGAALKNGGVGVVNGASTYQHVAASATATSLGATGAAGDYLSHCVIYPGTTGAGAVTVFDNTNSAANIVIEFATGTLSNLAPIPIPVGAVSTGGGWKITTGTNVTVACFGKFT